MWGVVRRGPGPRGGWGSSREEPQTQQEPGRKGASRGGCGELGRAGSVGWAGLCLPPPFFFPRYFAVFRHLVSLMIVPVTTCFWIFSLTVQRVGSQSPQQGRNPH